MADSARSAAAGSTAASDENLRAAVQSLETAVALADPATLRVFFENGRFFDWFPPDAAAEDPSQTLAERLPDLDPDTVVQRLDRRGRFTLECERKVGPRTLNVLVTIRSIETPHGPALLVECANVSKQREAEYMLDSYSKMMEKANRDLQKEKERTEKLLLNIMPKLVYEELRDFGATTPQRFDAASVLMLDFVGFTTMSVSREPSSIVSELNDIFSAFDRITELYGCERIKTIGDAYMAVSGLPEANEDHASNIAKVALRMRRYLRRRNESHPNQWRCRIGIATGPIIGSMVGIQKYVYDVFGPAVNFAARLEALCEPMQILTSQATRDLIKDDFTLGDLGEHDVRGFDSVTLYSLDDEHGGARR